MVRRRRGFGHWGAALAALLLILLALGPSLDSLICREEAATAATQVLVMAQADIEADGHGHETGDACAHGHCHHGSGATPGAPMSAETPALSAAPPPTLLRARVLTTNPKFGLMRPPRA